MYTHEEKKDLIKKHILKIYDNTNSKNIKELSNFLDFVISNYDLEDELFEQIQEDLDLEKDWDFKTLEEIENEEYIYNVLEPQLQELNRR